MLFLAILFTLLAFGGGFLIGFSATLGAAIGAAFGDGFAVLSGLVGAVIGVLLEVYIIYLAVLYWIAVVHGVQ